MDPLTLAAAGAAMGAVGGSMGSSQSQKTQIGQKSALGQQAEASLSDILKQFAELNKMGAGAKDVGAAAASQRSLANLYGQFAQGGYLPTASDIGTANQQAFDLFGAQRGALQSAFIDQLQQANRGAASLGRSTNDPILQAQLRGQQYRQSVELSGQQQALAQQLAMQMPQQRLQFATQQTDILNQLANQAFSNRQLLANTGSNIMNMQNQLRMAGSTVTASTPGGLQGAITGGLAGGGTGLTAAAYGKAGGLFG